MPSVLTGAACANRDLIYLGVSGDGDSASIGHRPVRARDAARRQHGPHRREQRRVRAHQGPVLGHGRQGQQSKRGAVNSDEPIDLAMLALNLGATFVARGFSGDKAQLVPLIKAAVAHHGAAFLDVVSPCVAFNNHPGSTKATTTCASTTRAVNRLDFISPREEITPSYAPGEVRTVVLHDGGAIRLRKVDDGCDPTDRVSAMAFMESRRGGRRSGHGPPLPASGHAPTHARRAFETVTAPLNSLTMRELVPGSARRWRS